ncbi:MAG TPA: phosphate ABC transporter substrate-binding protein [bacterium]|nr:phosphate ABC transporter substrate-binding protein [bacterium]
MAMAGCARSGRAGITLAGSTSVEPFAERLAELYMRAHADAKISVQGGGSSAGIRACQSRICAIGMSSRELTREEKGLVEIPIALDAIALIVNRQNPVRELTMEQARDVFAGRIRNWKELGGPNRRITPITREEGSGTRASFEEKVMATGTPKDKSGKTNPAAFAPDALVQDSNGAVREVVADDPAAIGYISAGLIDERVAAVTLNGFAPNEATILTGQYPVVRQFLFLTNGEATGTAKAFIEYVLSDSGQNALVEEGLTRIK